MICHFCVTTTRREEVPAENEHADEYGLGTRDGLQETVEAVMSTLGMQPCEGTEAVPPNARSHTVLLAGLFVGYQQVRTLPEFTGVACVLPKLDCVAFCGHHLASFGLQSLVCVKAQSRNAVGTWGWCCCACSHLPACL